MDNGEPMPTYEGLAAAFAKAKAEKEHQESQGLKTTSAQDNRKKEIQFKASHGLVVAFFFWLLALNALGIYLFTSGFLLTRLVLEHKSECSVPPIELPGGYAAGDAERGCWHPKTFERAVVVIIDALRYDFTVPFAGPGADAPAQHFHDAIPFFHEAAVRRPENAVLLPFIADPPTTTLQRLKGLTTGTLPTFIDAGSNFAGTAIDEDNLVAQLRTAGKRVVHLGDDTWHALFPGYFEPELTRAYDSFNVWDLHTVDDGVTAHIFPLLNAANSSRWDVIFGHYLGVDHAGHRYGPDHPAMAAKLRQMDDVVRRLAEAVDDDTLLVVMGDHGMDSKGDHGGESFDEVQAALWMYSKRGVFGRKGEADKTPPKTARERPVAQIDLVPTLALLLGLPIPFNNLGAPIAEAFIPPSSSSPDLANLAAVNRITAAQIHRYQAEYDKVRGGGDESSRPAADALWSAAARTWEASSAAAAKWTVGGSGDAWRNAADAYAAYQAETLAVCRSLWARFDLTKMIHGIEILAGTFAALLVYACGLEGDRAEVTPALLARGLAGSFLGAVLAFVGTIFIHSLPQVHSIVLGSAIGSGGGLAAGFHHVRARLRNPLPRDVWGGASALFTLALAAGLASNSYTVWEDRVLLFLLASMGALFLAASLRLGNPQRRALGVSHSLAFVVLGRLASFSRLCREEQMPHCRSTYYASATSSTSAPWQLALPLLVALLLPDVVRAYFTTTQSYRGSAPLWVGTAFRGGLLLTALYWTLDAADDGDWLGPDAAAWLKPVRVGVAQVVLAVAFAAGYSTFAWSAPMLSIETAKKSEGAEGGGEGGTSISPAAGGEGGADGASSGPITILGYANVHGTRYLPLLTMYFLAAALVTKPMGQLALACQLWQILAVLELTDALDLHATPAPAATLALLGCFHFFTTGHQAALSSVQWESAFIPLAALRYPWSPLLVALNTFAGPVLSAVAAPLPALWKQPPKKRGLLGDVARACAQHVLVYAAVGLATTVFAGWLRRHLMLYRVFSPRWMVGGAAGLVVQVVVAAVAVGGARWSFLSVAEIFGW